MPKGVNPNPAPFSVRSARVKRALARRKALGLPVGRPPKVVPQPRLLPGSRKLTREQEDAIAADTRSEAVIAAEYRVSRATVGNIRRYARWAKRDEEPPVLRAKHVKKLSCPHCGKRI